jgi:hypothetical protein
VWSAAKSFGIGGLHLDAGGDTVASREAPHCTVCKIHCKKYHFFHKQQQQQHQVQQQQQLQESSTSFFSWLSGNQSFAATTEHRGLRACAYFLYYAEEEEEQSFCGNSRGELALLWTCKIENAKTFFAAHQT